MTDERVSREERMERMRARIEGKEPQSQATSKRSPGHNLIFGVSLHAALRFSQGKSLSGLEEKVLSGLRVVCDDDEQEIAYYGSCFQRVKEQSRSAKEGAIFPACILDLDEEEPYTNKKLRQDIKRLGPEITSESANQVIDLGKVSSGWPIDSKEYLEALAAADGIGATLLTGPADSVSSRAARQSKGTNEVVKIRLKGFTCIEKFEEGLESVYWGHAAGSDAVLKEDGVTDTFEVAEESTYYPVDEILFEGDANTHLVAHLQCWVKYRGPSGWLDKVKKITQDVSDECVEAAMQDHDHDDEDEEGRTDDTAAVLAVATVAKNYIRELIKSGGDAFDDSLATRSVGFTQRGLDYFLEQVGYTIRMDFIAQSGKGQYRLEIDRIYESQPQPEGMGVVSSSDGESWSSIVTVPDSVSIHAMTVVECLGSLYGVFANQSYQICITKMDANENWEVPFAIPDAFTESHIGVGVVGGVMEIFYRGLNSRVIRLMSDFNQSDPMRNFENVPLKTLNLITSFGMDLELSGDGLVLCTTLLLNSEEWEKARLYTCFVLRVPNGWMWPFPLLNWQDELHSPPALVRWREMSFVCCTPSSGLKVYYTVLGIDGNAILRLQIKDFEFVPQISATALGKELWVAYQKSDGRVWFTVIAHTEGGDYNDYNHRHIETDFFAMKNTQPVIYTFNNKLYLTLANGKVV